MACPGRGGAGEALGWSQGCAFTGRLQTSHELSEAPGRGPSGSIGLSRGSGVVTCVGRAVCHVLGSDSKTPVFPGPLSVPVPCRALRRRRKYQVNKWTDRWAPSSGGSKPTSQAGATGPHPHTPIIPTPIRPARTACTRLYPCSHARTPSPHTPCPCTGLCACAHVFQNGFPESCEMECGPEPLGVGHPLLTWPLGEGLCGSSWPRRPAAPS